VERVGGRYLFIWSSELINKKEKKKYVMALDGPFEIFSRNNQPKTCGCD
jgi:hypothetical protein